MTQIQVDPVLLQRLGGLTESVELQNSQGVTLAHVVPVAEYKKMLYASVQIPLSEEEIARREAEAGEYTLEEIWKELGQK